MATEQPIGGFLKWFYSLVKIPLTLDECMKLLKEVNDKLESPSRYHADLIYAKEIFNLRIKQATEKITTLTVSDSEKQKELKKLIDELNTTQGRVQELIDLSEKAIKDRDTFWKAYELMKKHNEKLTEMLAKSQSILPPLSPKLGVLFPVQVLGSSPLADALFQQELQKVKAAALAGAVPSALTEALAQRTIKAKESEE